jgi:hypothetical protein
MQGEYRGDFTRDTFHRANHFCRVLMQQGRVQLDADWNEQAAILLHYLRNLGRDLIGQHGGPGGQATSAFAISAPPPPASGVIPDISINLGHYYVDGILCEVDAVANAGGATTAASVSYLTQPDIPDWKDFPNLPPGPNLPATIPNTNNPMLVYLDVWERHLTCVQQDLLREVALGGPDTATRAKIVWQVKIATSAPNGTWPKGKLMDSDWQAWTALWQPANRGFLKAQVQPQPMSTDPCITSPQSSYRGTENQLYRVEIHNGGVLSILATTDAVAPAATAASVGAQTAPTGPSFKWSRENGSVVFPILKLATSDKQTTVTLASLGRDSNLSLQVQDWVEVVDDNYTRLGVVDSLLQVVAVDPINLVVTLGGTSAIVVLSSVATHPILRRWDGIGPITENSVSQPANWLTLEDGIQIQFQPPVPSGKPDQPYPPTRYRSGDYWLIPARAATGSIEWPQQVDSSGTPGPDALPPHGIEHHYAPLSYIQPGSGPMDLRRFFTTQAT